MEHLWCSYAIRPSCVAWFYRPLVLFCWWEEFSSLAGARGEGTWEWECKFPIITHIQTTMLCQGMMFQCWGMKSRWSRCIAYVHITVCSLNCTFSMFSLNIETCWFCDGTASTMSWCVTYRSMFSDLYVTCIPWTSTLPCFIALFFRSATIFQQRTCFIIQKETPWNSMVVDFQGSRMDWTAPEIGFKLKVQVTSKSLRGKVFFPLMPPPRIIGIDSVFVQSIYLFFEMLQFLPEHLFQT